MMEQARRTPRPTTRPHQSATRGCLWRALGAAFIVAFLVAAAVLADELDLPRPLEKSLGRVLFFGGALAVLSLLLRRARQHEAPGADAVLDRDPRAPVLYLRPFADDPRAAHLVGSATEEEQLARVLESVGPVVAIGRPGERLPELGAARLYVSDDAWQAKVRSLLDRSALVVIRLGDTGACWWELDQAVQRVPPSRLVLLVPSPHALPSGTDGHAAILERAAARLGRPLPPPPAGRRRAGALGSVVVFGEDGTPRVLSPRGSFWRTRVSRPLEATLALTFRPVIERAGGAWRPPAINPLRVLVVVALGLWLVAMAALATGLLHE